jgi:hypothetical protein
MIPGLNDCPDSDFFAIMLHLMIEFQGAQSKKIGQK